MPYIFKETLDEGEEEATVVPFADYQQLEQARDNALSQRDEAITKMESLKTELREAKQKYADAFLKPEQPTPPINFTPKQGTPDKVFGFDKLFG